MKYLAFLFQLLIASCSESQEHVKSTITSIDDFINETEDPGIRQQLEAVERNGIRICTIRKWEHSVNTDSLELQSDSTIIYYNASGQIDSLIDFGYKDRKQYNFYDAQKRLEKRLTVEMRRAYSAEYDMPQTVRDSTISIFTYDGGKLVREEIDSPDLGKATVIYTWLAGHVSQIEISKTDNSTMSFVLTYENGRLKSRKITSKGFGLMSDRTNEFIYEGSNLTEITNTWILAGNSEIASLTPDGELSEIANTKCTYYASGWIKSLQKVYGMWPGESFWKTGYTYFDDGLLKEKEMHNDGEFGHTTMIYRYSYTR